MPNEFDRELSCELFKPIYAHSKQEIVDGQSKIVSDDTTLTLKQIAIHNEKHERYCSSSLR